MKRLPSRPKPPAETPLEGFSSIFGVLTLGLFALTFVFQNFVIPSSSMASTLLVGDHVLVERTRVAPPSSWATFMPYREVHHGDVVVFFKPLAEPEGDHIFLVKRVIGLPGDRIHLRQGVLYLNGVAQPEPYAAQTTPATYQPYVDDFPRVDAPAPPDVTAEWTVNLPTHLQGEDLVVPAGSYFMMGDNRDNSVDSRFWGFVPKANIIGRAFFVYWSFPTRERGVEVEPVPERLTALLHQVVHFFDETRWQRTFQPVR